MENKIKTSKTNITLSLIVFILIILVVSPLRDKLQHLVGFKEKDLKIVSSINMSLDEDVDARTYDGKVIVVDRYNINCYDYEKKRLWNKKINEKDEVVLGKSSFFINNKSNMSVTKFNLDGKNLWNYNISHPAYTMTEIENHLVVYSKAEENMRGVTILDQEGKLVLNKDKSKEEVLSCNISHDKDKFIITGIDTSSPELRSKLTYLSKNGEILWTEEVKDKIIYNVLFMDDDRLLLISDKEVICKDSEGETLWEKSFKYNFKDIEIIDGSEVYILYGIADAYLEILDIDGKTTSKKSFKKEYNDIEQLDKHILLIGKDGVIGFNNNKISMRNDLKGNINHVKKTNSEILIFKDKEIEIFKIVDKKSK